MKNSRYKKFRKNLESLESCINLGDENLQSLELKSRESKNIPNPKDDNLESRNIPNSGNFKKSRILKIWNFPDVVDLPEFLKISNPDHDLRELRILGIFRSSQKLKIPILDPWGRDAGKFHSEADLIIIYILSFWTYSIPVITCFWWMM